MISLYTPLYFCKWAYFDVLSPYFIFALVRLIRTTHSSFDYPFRRSSHSFSSLYTISLLILRTFVHFMFHLAGGVALAFVLCSISLVHFLISTLRLRIFSFSKKRTYLYTHPHSYLLQYMIVQYMDFRSITARET